MTIRKIRRELVILMVALLLGLGFGVAILLGAYPQIDQLVSIQAISGGKPLGARYYFPFGWQPVACETIGSTTRPVCVCMSKHRPDVYQECRPEILDDDQ